MFRITCVLIIVLIGILLLDAKLRPAVYDHVALEACALSSKTVNSAVEKTLSEKAPSYAETVTVTYGESGISGITTDGIKMNLFKSQVSNEIDSAFDARKNAEEDEKEEDSQEMTQITETTADGIIESNNKKNIDRFILEKPEEAQKLLKKQNIK